MQESFADQIMKGLGVAMIVISAVVAICAGALMAVFTTKKDPWKGYEE